MVLAGSHKKAWWICPENPEHVWESRIDHRTKGVGCPLCNSGWTVEVIRKFVSSMINHLTTFTPAELYLLFQQNGLLHTAGKSKDFVKGLVSGKFPYEEIKKFSNGDPSIIDGVIEALGQPTEETSLENSTEIEDVPELGLGENNPASDDLNEVLPIFQTKDVLESLNHPVFASADEEAVQFFIASAKSKIWKHAFQDETTAVEQAESFQGEDHEYAAAVRSAFLEEYHQAKNLSIPLGYAFQVNGKLTLPNLMQRLIAVQVRNNKRVGNWSGTGAGKTLSAVLTSRVVGAALTIICCPNNVVGDKSRGWQMVIREVFPDSLIAVKTFNPDWAVIATTQTSDFQNTTVSRYLILNYEMFQKPNSRAEVLELVKREKIDFIVIDEIHYTKHRERKAPPSQRKELVEGLIVKASERNPELRVLGMSATPIVNNLQEGKSMVELVTGIRHDDLKTTATISNCMKLHQQLVTLGIRCLPDYKAILGEPNIIQVEVDCGEYIEEIRRLGKHAVLGLEQILTRARLSEIRRQVVSKTLIYSHYIEEIDRTLKQALEQDGWKVGFYTGEDKTGYKRFVDGDLDVLIGTSAIGTGVDGLQKVCDRLIINVLPWTHAEFEQLVGRIYRQGQQRPVTVVIPLTYAIVNGERWSWCEVSKMQRIQFKRSIADAAVDGRLPEGHLRTAAQAYQDAMTWLKRLEAGELHVVTREKVTVPLSEDNLPEVQPRQYRFGDFAHMNSRLNNAHSQTTHERLKHSPEEWYEYHRLYREARQTWTEIPYEQIANSLRKRPDWIIGDFGCGEAKLAEILPNKIYSFDHVAINKSVLACDVANIPLEDNILDVAVFSLSLMGSNYQDYLKEANRLLKFGGWLKIAEPGGRWIERHSELMNEISEAGFTPVGGIEQSAQFLYINAIKAS